MDYKRSGWDNQVMDQFSAKWEYKEVTYEQLAINDVGETAFHKVEQDIIESLKTRFST